MYMRGFLIQNRKYEHARFSKLIWNFVKLVQLSSTTAFPFKHVPPGLPVSAKKHELWFYRSRSSAERDIKAVSFPEVFLTVLNKSPYSMKLCLIWKLRIAVIVIIQKWCQVWSPWLIWKCIWRSKAFKMFVGEVNIQDRSKGSAIQFDAAKFFTIRPAAIPTL